MVPVFRRIAALLMVIAVLCCLPCACAVEIPEPTLSPDANPYSAEHPELLEQPPEFVNTETAMRSVPAQHQLNA